ncbi:MAG: hypothetical protein H6679_01410 [Epsilonproteobacteria bacterium]|nr:hypothetical protein [Campylobacterota bacterium]
MKNVISKTLLLSFACMLMPVSPVMGTAARQRQSFQEIFGQFEGNPQNQQPAQNQQLAQDQQLADLRPWGSYPRLLATAGVALGVLSMFGLDQLLMFSTSLSKEYLMYLKKCMDKEVYVRFCLGDLFQRQRACFVICLIYKSVFDYFTSSRFFMSHRLRSNSTKKELFYYSVSVGHGAYMAFLSAKCFNTARLIGRLIGGAGSPYTHLAGGSLWYFIVQGVYDSCRFAHFVHSRA